MFDEQKVMDVIETDLIPSSVLCIGYPEQTKFQNLEEDLKDPVQCGLLIHSCLKFSIFK